MATSKKSRQPVQKVNRELENRISPVRPHNPKAGLTAEQKAENSEWLMGVLGYVGIVKPDSSGMKVVSPQLIDLLSQYNHS